MSGLLAPQQFAGDDGSADPALAAALRTYAQAREVAGGPPGPDALEPVVAALADARVMVAVVAVLGETEESGLTGLTSDKNADMSLVLLTAPDGTRALPVFSSLETLSRWNAAARPVPVEARRAALSGVDEGCEAIVLDPAGPVTAVLARPAVWAIGQGRAWVPSFRDVEVVAAVTRTCSTIDAVVDVVCEPGSSAELRVALRLVPGLDRARLDEVTGAVSRALAGEPVLAERVASVELRLR